MTISKGSQALIERVAEVANELGNIRALVSNLNDILNGTAKTGGLKERIALAEHEIELNKESFKRVSDNIDTLRKEMLIEIGNIAKNTQPKRLDWHSTAQVLVNTLVVGIVGIIFWKIIIPALASYAP